MNKQPTNIVSDELHIYSRVSTVEQKENGTVLLSVDLTINHAVG